MLAMIDTTPRVYTGHMVREDTLTWRVAALEHGHEKLDDQKADKDVVDRLANSVDGLRKSLLGFMATVAGSALVVSGTVLLSHLHIH